MGISKHLGRHLYTETASVLIHTDYRRLNLITHPIQSSEFGLHYDDVTMGPMASQITSLTIVYSTVYSDADQRKHQSSASLAFVWGIHRGPVNSPHKWPVTRKMFPFHDVIRGQCWNTGYPSETHLQLKSRQISPPPPPHNIHISCRIVLKFCTEHGSNTAVIGTRFQKRFDNYDKNYG